MDGIVALFYELFEWFSYQSSIFCETWLKTNLCISQTNDKSTQWNHSTRLCGHLLSPFSANYIVFKLPDATAAIVTTVFSTLVSHLSTLSYPMQYCWLDFSLHMDNINSPLKRFFIMPRHFFSSMQNTYSTFKGHILDLICCLCLPFNYTPNELYVTGHFLFSLNLILSLSVINF